MSVDSAPDDEPWSNDLLGRKPLADHLTRSLIGRSSRLDGGLTVSVDADWGGGKTFFVREWAKDLALLGHPVVQFDAWENDIGNEASVALMAAIFGTLDLWKEKLPAKQAVKEMAENLKTQTVKKLRRAVVPVATVVAKGLVKKAVGAGIEEIASAIDLEVNVDSGDVRVDEALDKLFEQSMREHESRQRVLKDFRSSLSTLLGLISKYASAKLPLFVFIDELDRCRPPYAIKLLEEVKHIFGVANVVYVVSTNISQLQNSVKAIYGADFDGRRYLNRMFDRQYSLPEGNSENFSKLLLSDFLHGEAGRVYCGLPQHAPLRPTLHRCWGIVCGALKLDLRSQKQVYSIFEESANGLDGQHRVHALWLLFLSALHLVKPVALEKISSDVMTKEVFLKMLAEVLRLDPSISYFSPNVDGFRGDRSVSETKFSAVLVEYFSLSKKTNKQLFDSTHENSYRYPSSIRNQLVEELGGWYGASSPQRPSIHRYPEVVLGAGYLAPKTEEVASG